MRHTRTKDWLIDYTYRFFDVFDAVGSGIGDGMGVGVGVFTDAPAVAV
jgi:hypothetical protein